MVTLICCAGLVAGAILTSIAPDEAASVPAYPTWIGILTTLASALLLALVVALLRRAAVSDRLKLSPLEATLWRLALSSVILTISSLAFDLDGFPRIWNAPWAARGLVIGGIFYTAVNQLTSVLMMYFFEAITVGVVSLMTVLPQVIISLAIGSPPPTFDAIHIAGYVITPLSCCAFGIYQIYDHRRAKKCRETNESNSLINER